MQLQPPRLFKLFSVRDTLDGRVRRHHDVLKLVGDRVAEHAEPRDGVIVLHLLPVMPRARVGDGHPFADVNDDVLRVDTLLDATLQRVLAAAAEQPGGLDAEVRHLLFAPVPHTVLVLGDLGVELCLPTLFFLRRHRQPLLLFFGEPVKDVVEFNEVQVADGVGLLPLVQDGLEAGKKVFAKDWIAVVIAVLHASKESGDFLFLSVERERAALVLNRNAMRDVGFGEERPVVLQGGPLLFTALEHAGVDVVALPPLCFGRSLSGSIRRSRGGGRLRGLRARSSGWL